MKNEIKYLINIHTKIKSIKELTQYLTLYSTIFFSEDGKKAEIVDKENNKKYTVDSCIKSIEGDKDNYYTISVYQEDGVELLEFFDELINCIIHTQKDLTKEKFIILEDGISEYYASKAYSKLFHTENKIRAFITEMMSYFGPEKWAMSMGKRLIGSNVKDDYDNRFLYQTDFDHLQVFLTKEHKENEAEEVLKEVRKKMEKLNGKSEISEVLEIKKYIREKKPYTIWDRFVKEYTKTDWEKEQFKNKMDSLYSLRCKIAHSNSFRKENYDEFKSLSDEMIQQMEKLTLQIEEINEIDDETIALLNEAADELNIEDTSKDTLIVPAKPEGFEDVFIGENRWYHIRISDEKINQIKYIAAYEAHNNKFIQYYAEVDYIENSKIKEGYKVVYFKNKATLLPNYRKIQLGKNKYYAPQSIRYVSSEKLFDENVKTLDQLFN